jgi:polyisoprenoid-binding protein YceI
MTAPTQTTRTFAGATIPAAGEFAIDPAHTTVGFVVRHLMVSKVRGSFATVTGNIAIAEDPAESSVAVEIDAASISTGSADRDAHLRSPDFLDVQRYPTLVFRSERLEGFRDGSFILVGDLTIRDVRREVRLAVEFDGAARSPFGQDVIAFSATTEIDREEFGITWNQALEAGGVLVGPKVKIEIAAEAVRSA